MQLSVVLPTYNERKNLEIFIPQLEETLSKRYNTFEIIISDSSSPDGTSQLVKELHKTYKNIRLYVRAKDGIGAAIISGCNHARGTLIFSMDADCAFELCDIHKMLDKVEEGYDMVVGAKHFLGGYSEIHSFNQYIKGFISKNGNRIMRKVLRIPIQEFTLNFRIIRKSMWKQIKVVEKQHVMLLETVYKVRKAGGKLGQVPVTFKDRKHGESKIDAFDQGMKTIKPVLKWTIEEWTGIRI